MDTHPFNFHHRSHQTVWLATAIGFLLTGLLAAYLLWTRSPRIVRGVTIQGIAVAGLTQTEARQKLIAELPELPNHQIKVSSADQEWATAAAQLGLHRDLDTALNQAVALGRHQLLLTSQSLERVQLLATPRDIAIPWLLDDTAVRDWVATIAAEVNIEGQAPTVKLTKQSFVIDPGIYGQRLQNEVLIQDLKDYPLNTAARPAPIEPTHIPLTPDALIMAEKRLQVLRSARLILHLSDAEPDQTLTAVDFFPWVELPLGWNAAAIDQYLTNLASKENQAAVDAIFELDETQTKLQKFQPERIGRTLDQATLRETLLHQLLLIEQGQAEAKPTVAVPWQTLEPAVKLADLNTLGVNERLGVGDSTFFHSIPNRVDNVALTSRRLHATLVPPGEEFSFNRAVGEISRQTGYKPAYIIAEGRTILGDGGGVCQVSTTTFRAMLSAGLPITQWKAHSYRVGYYEQNMKPGFDATVYSPSGDLRFRNDTDHYVALATIIDVDNRHLTIEIWGTSDGRQATTSNYQISNQTGAPAPAYLPDPTLPKGTTRQIDWSAPGATTRFTYTVTDQNGATTFQREFVSHFQAWRAVYLVGTQ